MSMELTSSAFRTADMIPEKYTAMRKALVKFYPKLKEVELLDYKVRVLTTGSGTAANVRVLIESGDSNSKWVTVGVSEDVVEASYQALVDSMEYKLLKKS